MQRISWTRVNKIEGKKDEDEDQGVDPGMAK